MKYALLSLPLIAAATLAAARETSLDPSRWWESRQPDTTAPSLGDPPWLTGALDPRLIAESAAADPHARLGLGHAEHDHAHDHAEHDHQHAPDDAVHAAYHGGGDPHDPHYAHPDGDPHGALRAGPEVEPLPRSTAPNARDVAEIVAQRAALNEGLVRVHARVVKLTEGVLGKTYLHLRDGSGSATAGDHDLTATTTEPFELGEAVEVEGRVTIDQDLGFGYRYPVLLVDVRRVTR